MKEKTFMIILYLVVLGTVFYLGVLACAIFWRGVF
jgi:hypothetical protein